jgi:hypothetical protein
MICCHTPFSPKMSKMAHTMFENPMFRDDTDTTLCSCRKWLTVTCYCDKIKFAVNKKLIDIIDGVIPMPSRINEEEGFNFYDQNEEMDEKARVPLVNEKLLREMMAKNASEWDWYDGPLLFSNPWDKQGAPFSLVGNVQVGFSESHPDMPHEEMMENKKLSALNFEKLFKMAAKDFINTFFNDAAENIDFSIPVRVYHMDDAGDGEVRIALRFQVKESRKNALYVVEM